MAEIIGKSAFTPDLLRYKPRRVCLEYHGQKLEVFEHIGVLRWFGLDGVAIESTPWPPYHGRPYELWEKVLEAVEEISGEHWKWFSISGSVGAAHNSSLGYTEIKPHNERELYIKITSRYDGIGTEEMEFNYPEDLPFLEIAMRAHALGWPIWTYYLSKAASVVWWPHHSKVTWLQEKGPDETLRLIVLHRLVDLLGPLSIAAPEGLLAAQIESFASGHRADVHALQLVPFFLRQL